MAATGLSEASHTKSWSPDNAQLSPSGGVVGILKDIESSLSTASFCRPRIPSRSTLIDKTGVPGSEPVVTLWRLLGSVSGPFLVTRIAASPPPSCGRGISWSVGMDCLWITLADPDPATNGQLIYSEGLIRSAQAAQAALCVVGLVRSEKFEPPRDEPGLAWRLGDETCWPRWRRALRAMP